MSTLLPFTTRRNNSDDRISRTVLLADSNEQVPREPGIRAAAATTAVWHLSIAVAVGAKAETP